MNRHVENLIVGQGLAGSAIAWTLHWSGQSLLLIDREQDNTASKVSAGLVTPMTGKRLVKSARFEEYWSVAVAFYRRVEHETDSSFFEETDMIRLFEDEVARSAFIRRSEAESLGGIEHWEGQVQTGGIIRHGIAMSPAARVNVNRYLEVTRSYFAACDSYQQMDVDFEKDFSVKDEEVQLASQRLSAQRLISCQGVETNTMFPSVPNNPSRGDILTVNIPEYERTEVLHRSVWIAPNSDGSQTVGSTYDWKNQTAEPTDAGRQEVLQKLNRIVAGTIAVSSHVASVRPTMKDYEPVIGQHSRWKNVFIFNGLGSKGTLRSPLLAKELLDAMEGGEPPRPSVNVSRLQPPPTAGNQRRSLTQQAQETVAATLQAGDTAIDATVGNGFDTCFLSHMVGETGRVVGFDVQQSALDSTRQRLASEGLSNVELLQQGHETLGQVLPASSVATVMFNLGYLPRHDHQIITQPETSVQAIKAALKTLKPGGVLTVLAYRGHDGGQDEFEAVERLLLDLGQHYDLSRVDSTPTKATSPVLYVLRKSRTAAI